MNPRTKKILLTVIVVASCALTVAATAASEYLRAAVYDGNLPYAMNLSFGLAERLLLTVAAAALMFAFGCAKTLRPRLRGGILATAAGLAVAAANFPFFCLADGSLRITTDGGGAALFVFYCLGVGLFEETVFRGFLFPMLLGVTAKKKHGVLAALLATNALFALVHLFNLFQGAGVGATFLQVGYTFLVGCMCNVIFIATRSLAAPVLVHALFNIGGTMTDLGAATGSQWNAPAATLMAVVAVLAGSYLAVWLFRHRDRALTLIED